MFLNLCANSLTQNTFVISTVDTRKVKNKNELTNDNGKHKNKTEPVKSVTSSFSDADKN